MSMTPTLPYPLFDADNHLYQTQDSLTKYLPTHFADALGHLPVQDEAKIMGRNLSRLVTV